MSNTIVRVASSSANRLPSATGPSQSAAKSAAKLNAADGVVGIVLDATGVGVGVDIAVSVAFSTVHNLVGLAAKALTGATEATQEEIEAVFGAEDGDHLWIGSPLDMENTLIRLDLPRRRCQRWRGLCCQRSQDWSAPHESCLAWRRPCNSRRWRRRPPAQVSSTRCR